MIARLKLLVHWRRLACKPFDVRRQHWWDVYGRSRTDSTLSFAVVIFRVAVGILGAIYFANQLTTIDLYVGEERLIPTEWIQSSFGHSRPLISDLVDTVVFGQNNDRGQSNQQAHLILYALLGFGLLASVAVVWGVFPRILSLLVFFATTASTAWTYPLTYVDDSVIALSFFWVALLPEKIDRRSSIALHAQELVVRVITYHVGVLYFLSGVWKLSSPMWRQGDALFAILMMPSSRFSEYWQSHPSSILPLLNNFVVAVEIVLPFFLLSTSRKWRFFGVGMQCMLHIGISVLMYVPYANLALTASSLLFLRREWDDFFHIRSWPKCISSRPEGLVPQAVRSRGVRQRERFFETVYRPFTILYLMLILSAGLGELPGLRLLRIHQVSQSILNAVGLNHGFRLFDWIDSRAFIPHWRLSWEDFEGGQHQVELKTIMTESMRSAILSTYFVGQPWIVPLPQERIGWQKELARQFSHRFCRKIEKAVFISADVHALKFALEGVVEAGDADYIVADRLPCSGLIAR